jgi:hypothetical protein
MSIYHHKSVELAGDADLNGSAHVFLHANGGVSVTMQAAYGAAHMSMQINADGLRAFAKLLTDAVEALPVKVEEAA